jgi:hypothetical protein
MDFIGFNNLLFFFLLNYCLFNYIKTKIDNHKIEHQTNTETFFKDYNNLIKSKTKQIMKFGSQSIQNQMMKSKKMNL